MITADSVPGTSAQVPDPCPLPLWRGVRFSSTTATPKPVWIGRRLDQIEEVSTPGGLWASSFYGLKYMINVLGIASSQFRLASTYIESGRSA